MWETDLRGEVKTAAAAVVVVVIGNILQVTSRRAGCFLPVMKPPPGRCAVCATYCRASHWHSNRPAPTDYNVTFTTRHSTTVGIRRRRNYHHQLLSTYRNPQTLRQTHVFYLWIVHKINTIDKSLLNLLFTHSNSDLNGGITAKTTVALVLFKALHCAKKEIWCLSPSTVQTALYQNPQKHLWVFHNIIPCTNQQSF